MKITKQRLQQIIQEEINSYKASQLNESIDMDTLENLSRPIHPTLHVVTHNDSSSFIERLRSDGFEVMNERDGLLRITPVAPAQIATVWRHANETGTRIRKLTPAMNSLDKIFIDTAMSAESEVD